MLVTNEQTVLKITAVSAPGCSTPADVLVAERRRAGPCRRGSRRQMALRQQDHEREHEERGVEREHGERVLLPAHLGRLAVPEQPEQRQRTASIPLPTRSGGGSRTRAIHQPRGIEPAIGRPIAQNGCNNDKIQCADISRSI